MTVALTVLLALGLTAALVIWVLVGFKMVREEMEYARLYRELVDPDLPAVDRWMIGIPPWRLSRFVLSFWKQQPVQEVESARQQAMRWWLRQTAVGGLVLVLFALLIIVA